MEPLTQYDIDRALPPAPPAPRAPLRPRWVSGERLVGEDEERWADFFFVESDRDRHYREVSR